jgi:histidinol-phosphate aminotransferase
MTHHEDFFTHGGPDGLGVPLCDFSTNANACGPCDQALAAVQQAPAANYPDPAYTQLRQALAAFHGVVPERVLPMASASEAMGRITAAAVRLNLQRVWYPAQHYADVARLSQTWARTVVAQPSEAELVWCCEPATPHGQNQPGLAAVVAAATTATSPGAAVVLDCAYAPLRLSGEPSLDEHALSSVWQLWSPNKALGLTGVRAAYVIAPVQAVAQPHSSAGHLLTTVKALAPSWAVGAHGVALLNAWTLPTVQRWLATSRQTLTRWKTQQLALCDRLGWACQPSDTHFHLAQPGPDAPDADAMTAFLAHLREHNGIKLRDAASFGLPGWVRLGVLSPQSQQALYKAVLAWRQREQSAPATDL